MLTPTNIDELWMLIRKRLEKSGYGKHHETEAEFEVEVWRRIVRLAAELGLEAESTCLTSHAIHPDRSVAAWKRFLGEKAGPDVEALGSKNRLDIVFRHPSLGSVGIEVKCLGRAGHTAKLTQSIGQAMLGLWSRERTVVAIHCGTVSTRQRADLREIGESIFKGTKSALVVVP
jgi:hypothetical protein